MKFRASLLAKIYLATAVAVTAIFAAAGWFFLYQASAALHAGVGQEVRAGMAAVDASLESRTEHLATASALLASMSDIRAAFGTRDTATIRDTAGEFWARAEAGHHHVEDAVFVVAAPAGIVLVTVAGHTPSALEMGKQIPESVIDPARRHALRLDSAGEVVHLFHRFSREQRVLDLPSLAAAARGAAHRAIEAVRARGRCHLRTPA